MLAAPASVLIMSRFGYVTRSPPASTENGPASMRRIHSSITLRVVPATIDGSAMPTLMAPTRASSAAALDARVGAMRVGMALPSMVAGTTRNVILEWMRRIDAGPFSVLAGGERVTYPNLDMMSTLAGAASITERVAIEASVSVLPMHRAVHVAKQAATIDVLSGGRFVLGVGVGGRDDDYRAYDAPTERKHVRLDEQVACIRRTWRQLAP